MKPFLSIFLLVSYLSFIFADAGVNVNTHTETKKSGLIIDYLHVPDESKCATKSKVGQMLTMHYSGMLHSDGSKFDSSFDRNQPFTFQIGVGQVIKGWDEGLVDMCEGERRKLTIPPHLGYGEKGAGDKIPGGSTLVFETELIKISDDAPPTPNIFKEIDVDDDKQLSRDEISKYLEKQIAAAGQAKENNDELKQMLQDQNKMIEEIFQHEDVNKDGFISHEEFSGPKHDEL